MQGKEALAFHFGNKVIEVKAQHPAIIQREADLPACIAQHALQALRRGFGCHREIALTTQNRIIQTESCQKCSTVNIGRVEANTDIVLPVFSLGQFDTGLDRAFKGFGITNIKNCLTIANLQCSSKAGHLRSADTGILCREADIQIGAVQQSRVNHAWRGITITAVIFRLFILTDFCNQCGDGVKERNGIQSLESQCTGNHRPLFAEADFRSTFGRHIVEVEHNVGQFNAQRRGADIGFNAESIIRRSAQGVAGIG